MENIKILVVDDEEDLCEILKFNLEAEGYKVDTASSGEEALAMDPEKYSLILLDVMMGGMSGFAVAKKLKENEDTSHIPIIFLTARGAENDRITGFSLGADDYIPKPFSVRELLMRVHAVLRRSGTLDEEKPEEDVTYEGIVIDPGRKTVSIDGSEVPFTKTEYGILRTLISHPGRVFSRHDLIKLVWPEDVLVSDRTVDVNITRVRKKLGAYSDKLRTRLGFGYYFGE